MKKIIEVSFTMDGAEVTHMPNSDDYEGMRILLRDKEGRRIGYIDICYEQIYAPLPKLSETIKERAEKQIDITTYVVR